MTPSGVVAVALTEPERELLVAALRLAEEHDANRDETRPLIDLLEHAPDAEGLRQTIGAITP